MRRYLLLLSCFNPQRMVSGAPMIPDSSNLVKFQNLKMKPFHIAQTAQTIKAIQPSNLPGQSAAPTSPPLYSNHLSGQTEPENRPYAVI
jgi:hypothetical protein